MQVTDYQLDESTHFEVTEFILAHPRNPCID